MSEQTAICALHWDLFEIYLTAKSHLNYTFLIIHIEFLPFVVLLTRATRHYEKKNCRRNKNHLICVKVNFKAENSRRFLLLYERRKKFKKKMRMHKD